MRVVARRHVLYAGSRVHHTHERRVRVELFEYGEQLPFVQRFFQLRLNRQMNASGERPGVRHERELCLDSRSSARARSDFRDVPVG